MKDTWGVTKYGAGSAPPGAAPGGGAPPGAGSSTDGPAPAAPPTGASTDGPQVPGAPPGTGDDDKASTVARYVGNSGGAVLAMRRYIASFTVSDGQRLTEQAPCRSFRHLLVLTEYSDLQSRLERATSKEDIAHANNFYKQFKAAYTELVAMGKSAANRLTTAIDNANTDEVKTSVAAKGKAKAKAKAHVATAAKVSIWQSHGSFGTAVPSHVHADDSRVSKGMLTLPVIIRLDPKLPKVLPDSAMGKSCTAFDTKFAKSDERVNPGRAQRKVGNDDAQADADQAFASWYPDVEECKVVDLGAELEKTLATAAFAIAKGKDTISAETGHLASARLVFKGPRRMILINWMVLWDYLESSLKMADLDLDKVYRWIKRATVENFKTFLTDLRFKRGQEDQKSALFYCTVGLHDVLHIPAGWIFMESVSSSDCIGVRHVHAAKCHLPIMEEINRRLLATGGENPILQGVVDKSILA